MNDRKLAELIRLFARATNAAASHQDEMTKRVIRSITKGAEAVAEELEKTVPEEL